MRLIDADALLEAGRHTVEFQEQVADEYVLECLIVGAPIVDAVEVDKVAEMLYRAIGDRYACDVNGNDEWLSEVCELQEECPHPADRLGCWKQFVKHYGERGAE